MRLRTFLIVFNAIVHLLVIIASITLIYTGYSFVKTTIFLILGSIINLFVGITLQNQISNGANVSLRQNFKNNEKINL